jgi:hypothetical protein
MRTLNTLTSNPGRPTGLEPAIGQIDLLDDDGQISASWRIQSSRCTVGSARECSVILDGAGIAAVHATLIFGKRHTLLRANAPTRIGNRQVREWLIDHPTEIQIGFSRLIVRPTAGVMATVVHAERLLDQAARLCKEPTPVVFDSEEMMRASKSTPAVPLAATQNDEVPEAVASPFDRIEQLLHSLQTSLDRFHDTLATESKRSGDSISSVVVDQIDTFGKTLFTTLNEQFGTHQDSSQALLRDLSSQVSTGFGSIDQQLQAAVESTSHQTAQLQQLLAQAISDRSVVEERFTEITAHRNELLDAFQILRNEIARSAVETNGVDHLQSVSSSYDSSNNVGDDQIAESLERAQVQLQSYNHELRDLEDEKATTEQRIADLVRKIAPDAAESNDYESSFEDSQSAIQTYLEPVAPQEYSYGEQEAYASVVQPYFDEQVAASEQDRLYATDDQVSNDHATTYQNYRAEDYPVTNDAATEYAATEYAATEYQQSPSDQASYPDSYSHSTAESVSYYADEQQPDNRELEVDHHETQRSDSVDSGSAAQSELPSWFTLPQQPYAHSNADEDSLHAHEVESIDSFSSNPEAEMIARLRELTSENFSDPNHFEEAVGDEARISQNYGSESKEQPELDSDTVSQRLQRMMSDASVRRASNPVAASAPTQPASRRWSEEFSNGTISNSTTSNESIPGHLEDGTRNVVEYSEDDEASVNDNSHNRSEQVEIDLPYSSDADSITNQLEDEVDEVMEVELESAVDPLPSEDETKRSFVKASHAAEEESIEDYMQRLLQRVRGDSDSSPATKQNTPTVVKPSTKVGKSQVAASMGLDVSKGPATEESGPPLTQESFVPRQQAPELRDGLAAMRELANSNARRAISRSDNRRSNAAFYIKLGITALAASSAVAILLLNGLQINMPFVGMIAAIVVTVLWGYDCMTHFNRSKSGESHREAVVSDGESDPLNPVEPAKSRWRPTQA